MNLPNSLTLVRMFLVPLLVVVIQPAAVAADQAHPAGAVTEKLPLAAAAP